MPFRLAFFVLLIFPYSVDPFFRLRNCVTMHAMMTRMGLSTSLILTAYLRTRFASSPRFPIRLLKKKAAVRMNRLGFPASLDGTNLPNPQLITIIVVNGWSGTSSRFRLPLPDGEACVGFRDGYTDLRNENPRLERICEHLSGFSPSGRCYLYH